MYCALRKINSRCVGADAENPPGGKNAKGDMRADRQVQKLNTKKSVWRKNVEIASLPNNFTEHFTE